MLLACYLLGVKKLNMGFSDFSSNVFKEIVDVLDFDVSEASYGDVSVETL